MGYGLRGERSYSCMHDRLGSVRILINTSGNVENYYTYDPFGELFDSEKQENVTNPFMFTGQWFDAEIDQYCLRARMYDPHIGRFTSRDPLFGKFKEPMTLHQYLYCQNDPINNIDPDGRFFGLASLLVGGSMESQLRKMDLKFHMDLFRKVEGKIDAFSMMNLQRGVMYDLMAESIESDLRSTLQEAGVEALGLISPNLSRLLSFVKEVSDKSEVILNVLKGIKQWDDFIGEQIPETIIEELL